MVTLSDAIKEAYASAPPSVVILHTIELWHPDWEVPVRLVQGFDDITATLEDSAPVNPGEAVVFSVCPFGFVLPQVGEGRQELQVQIDNVSLALMPLLESLNLASTTPITLTYRPYLSTDLTGPHMDPPLSLDLVGVTANLKQVVGTCAHANWANRRFPREIYTAEDFPGIAPRV